MEIKNMTLEEVEEKMKVMTDVTGLPDGTVIEGHTMLWRGTQRIQRLFRKLFVTDGPGAYGDGPTAEPGMYFRYVNGLEEGFMSGYSSEWFRSEVNQIIWCVDYNTGVEMVFKDEGQLYWIVYYAFEDAWD